MYCFSDVANQANPTPYGVRLYEAGYAVGFALGRAEARAERNLREAREFVFEMTRIAFPNASETEIRSRLEDRDFQELVNVGVRLANPCSWDELWM